MSVSHTQSSDREAALAARQKAVDIYRILNEAEPGIHEDKLARELLELSKDLAGNGLIEDAFKASQESGRRCRNVLRMMYPAETKAFPNSFKGEDVYNKLTITPQNTEVSSISLNSFDSVLLADLLLLSP
ncbi:unnamed protein product [Rhizoctonia solani]|uniref:Uncharacterized protein n=1 Tax=Rhizoctonia solani TaxID=456999 RepID=A0A8H2XMA9_9AGAM|nr:unnamed protein product [Rhizoctonia solani]